MRWVLGADEYDPVLETIESELRKGGHEVMRVGATSQGAVAWGPLALDIAERVARGDADGGVVCCYTGTGVSMAANKVPKVRAALCVDAETARGARRYNDANVLALSLRLTTPTLAKEIVRAWLETVYDGTEEPSLAAIDAAERSR